MLLFTQLQFESLRLFRSPVFWIMLLLYTALLAFGLHNGVLQVREKQRSLQEMSQRQQRDLLVQKAEADSIARGLKNAGGWWKNPGNAIVTGGMWRGGRLVGIAPAPQNILASGISDLQPNIWRLALLDKDARGDTQFDNPVRMATGHFDLAFVLALLLPLLVMALAFNIISAESEQGTLALHQIQPVSIQELFFHKIVARFLLIAGVVAFGILGAGALAGIPLGQAALWQTALIAILYAFFWFMVALGINLYRKSSAQNALLCIGAWLGFTIVIPAGINMLAQKKYPIPSRAGYQTEIRALENLLEDNRDARLAAYYKSNPHLTQKPEAEKEWQDWYRESIALHPEERRLRDSIDQQYTKYSDQQTALSEKLAICSPTLSLYRQINDMAGVSKAAYEHLDQQLDTLQTQWAAVFLQKFEQGVNLNNDDFDRIMAFPDHLYTAALPNAWQGLMLLVVQCLLAVL